MKTMVAVDGHVKFVIRFLFLSFGSFHIKEISKLQATAQGQSLHPWPP